MADPAHRRWFQEAIKIEWDGDSHVIRDYYRAKLGRKVSDDTAYWLYYIRERDALFAMSAPSKQNARYQMVRIEEE